MKGAVLCIGLWFLTLPAQAAKPISADLVIYGGTSAAVIAAVQADLLGISVVIVCPETHLGGMTSNGLGWTDAGNTNAVGGLAREFYHRIYLYYLDPSAWKQERRETFENRGQGTPAIRDDDQTMWVFEPHVAETVFEKWIAERGIRVFRDEWLDRANGVSKKSGRIQSVRMLSGKTFRGKVYIDATYEGDLMAAAGISYHVGREANRVYSETWNGVQTGARHHDHYFKANISPYVVPDDPASGLLPRISAEPPGADGEGDRKVQAYCFRMCLTDDPDNRIPFQAPEGYDPHQYELLVRVLASGQTDVFTKFDRVPNRKTDTNNHGSFSTDNIGMNYDYPEASYERRREILAEHERYQKGLLYFLSNDPRVPDEIRSRIRKWGLAKDEFVDNGGWPRQIYVREARRMIGAYVMTEHDVLGRKETPQPVGMGSYGLDSHNVQRYVTLEGYVQNEGDIGVQVPQPYRIAYSALTPKAEECRNLLVPVCCSSSHIAYGSIRMEPVYMILGQSAAAAAALAVRSNCAVQDVDYYQLKQTLLNFHQSL
ncbi:MAG: FAD-dependent oxidoreductase [candidate division KSB1 bacterium]|nr:FAD-dependent oxidoreductase [candidate division KSB1 bacterium]